MRAVTSWPGGAPDAADAALLVPLLASALAALVLGVLEWRSSPRLTARQWLWLMPVLILGGVLRFAWADARTPWEDEGLTAIRTAGARASAVTAQVRAGVGLVELRRYARPAPGTLGWFLLHPSHHTADVHPPLYFVLARLWLEMVGAGIHALRLFSGLLGLLAIPAAGWLALEASGSSRPAWLAAFLLAVAPLQVVYSQEARMYSLLVLMTLASTAALVRFLKLGGWRRAALYGALVGLGCQTHGLFALLVAGHAACVLVLHASALRPRIAPALAAAAAGVACGGPWVVLGVLRGRQERVTWLLSRPDLPTWIHHFVGGLAANLGTIDPFHLGPPLVALAVFLGLAELGRRRAPWASLVAASAGAWLLAIVVLDASRGSALGTFPRYFLAPTGLLLVLAGLGLDGLAQRFRIAGSLVSAGLLALMTLSALDTSRSPRVWYKDLGLSQGVTDAWRAASPATLYVFAPAAANDLVAMAEATDVDVWVVSPADPQVPSGAFVWSRWNERKALARRLGGSLEPIGARVFRFKRWPGAAMEVR